MRIFILVTVTVHICLWQKQKWKRLDGPSSAESPAPEWTTRCSSYPGSILWLSQISPDMNISTGCGDTEAEPVWAEGAGALNGTCFERKDT